MCHSNGSCGGGKCTMSMVSHYLLIVGGLNWGLVGLGMLLGSNSWNVLNMLLGSVPVLEAVVYVLVGLAAVMAVFGGCRCSKCTTCGPSDHNDSAPSEAKETTAETTEMEM